MMNTKYTMTCIVGQLRETDIDVQAVNQPLACPFGLLEGLAAAHLARTLVRNSEHDPTTAQIGHGAGVLGEIVELVGVLRLLEFDILAFLGVQQFGYGYLSSVGLSSLVLHGYRIIYHGRISIG